MTVVYEQAKLAIGCVFGDTSVDALTTAARLMALAAKIEECLAALKDDGVDMDVARMVDV